MKLALAALITLSALPVSAESIGDRSNRLAYQSQRGYASENKCYRNEYREEYIPGNSRSPGYVVTHRERVKVPCEGQHYTPHEDEHPNLSETDDNSCIEGGVLGAIGGAGAAAAMSREDGRLWAIPLGIVGGAMVGCQIDGG
tara:strand:+ start:238 stop:663 length:426 start_codon:yes stop_codon:yes gene_type:complete